MRILGYVAAAFGMLLALGLFTAISERTRARRPIIAASVFAIGALVAAAIAQAVTGSWLVFWGVLVFCTFYGWHRANRAPIVPR